MDAYSRNGLVCLWATDGSERALEGANIIRHLVLPAARRIHVVAVAPLAHAMRNRLSRLSPRHRERLLDEASYAAERSLAALGQLEIPHEARVCWGAMGAELARETIDREADLIALAPGPPRPGQRRGLGETTEELFRLTHKPLLLTRPMDHDRLGPVILLRRSHESFALVVSLVSGLALERDMTVILAAFLEEARPEAGMLLTLNERVRKTREASRNMHAELTRADFLKAGERLGSGRTRPVRHVIGEGNVVRGLEALARDSGASLVVAAARPLGEPSDLALRVAANMPCSVLLAR